IIFLGENEERVNRIERVLNDYQIDVVVNKNSDQILSKKNQILQGSLQNGFEMPMYRLAVITEGELFHKRAKRTKHRQKLSNAERIKSYSELSVGDYVVHVNHGIGKYLGIETLEINGVHKDYLHIRYQGDDKLYVPIDQIHLVQKYVGS